MYPIHSDDWMYSFVFNEEPVRFIGNIEDIFVSQYNHYLYWGGRNVVHFIDQFLLLLPALPREIINSLAFMSFALVIYKIANTKNTLSPFLFLFVGAVLWLGLPTLPQTVIWITGSANYLWGTLIVLLFIYHYYAYIRSEKKKDSVFWNVLFLIGGIIAGWTNENLVVAEIFILVMFFVYMKIRYIDIPSWAVYGFIGVLVGCIIMLAAPGNFLRSHDTHVALNLEGKPLGEVLWFKARNIYFIYRYIPTVVGLIAAYILSALIYCFVNRTNRNEKVILVSVLFFIAAHVSALAMIASPIFPVRASFCMHAFMIVAIAVLYGDINLKTKVVWALNILFLVILSVWTGLTYYNKYYEPLIYLQSRYETRELYIKSEKDRGVQDVVISEPGILMPGQFDFEDITADEMSWRNRICADYYKVKSIKRVDK